MKDIVLITIAVILVLVDILAVIGCYIHYRKKSSLIIYNFCNWLSKTEINAIIKLLKVQNPNINLNSTIIIYGHKWQRGLFEFDLLITIYYHKILCKLTKTELPRLCQANNDVLGVNFDKLGFISILGYNQKEESGLLKKVNTIGTILHEIYHHNITATTPKDLIREELEADKFVLEFLKHNLAELNKIFVSNGEYIDNICELKKSDMDEIIKTYEKIYGIQMEDTENDEYE